MLNNTYATLFPYLNKRKPQPTFIAPTNPAEAGTAPVNPLPSEQANAYGGGNGGSNAGVGGVVQALAQAFGGDNEAYSGTGQPNAQPNIVDNPPPPVVERPVVNDVPLWTAQANAQYGPDFAQSVAENMPVLRPIDNGDNGIRPVIMRPGDAEDSSNGGVAAPNANNNAQPLSPIDKARTELERVQADLDHPQNRDKGWKGLVKELIQNFLYGMGKTPQDGDWKQALALGGVGAGAGFLNKGWNERRQAEAELPYAQQRLQYEMENAKRGAAIANIDNQMWNRNREGDNKALTANASAKLAGIRGDVALGGLNNDKQRTADNTRNVDSLIADRNADNDRAAGESERKARIAAVNAAITPESVGILDDKEINDRVTANTPPVPSGTRLRADAATRAPQYFLPDGTFNEAQYWSDRGLGVNKTAPSDIYENLPSTYEQKRAAGRESIRSSQKQLKQDYASLMAAVQSARPKKNAVTVTPDEVRQLFLQVQKMSGKQREAAMTKLKASLSEMRIGQ